MRRNQSPFRFLFAAVISLVGACTPSGGSGPIDAGNGTGGSVGTGTGGSVATGTGGSSVTGTGGGAGGGISVGTGGSGGGSNGGGGTSGTVGGGGSPGTGGGASGGAGGSASGGSGGRTGGSGAGGGGNPGSGGLAGGGAAGGATGFGGVGGFGFMGASRCATAGVALCENFENGLDTALWTTRQSGDGSVVVDGVHAARGTKALHVKTTAGNGFAYITEKKTFPATNNILYGRMFVWFEDDLTTDGHFTLAEGTGTGTPGVSRFGGQFKEFGVGSDGGPSGDWTDHDNKVIPSKTWICAEFQFKGDTHEFRVWWDDAERTMLHRGPSQHANFTMPAFNALWFGYWMYNMVEPQELWIDEIAVDYKPIGCTK